MSSALKSLLRRWAPRGYRFLQSRFAPYPRLARQVGHRTGLAVASGPFAGLRYPDPGFCHRIVPKLLGSYEAELHEVLAALARRRWPLVVNVGAAEGYYAVGLARTLSPVRLIAFEADEGLADRCRVLAALNGVSDRIEVRGRAGPEEFQALPLEGALVVMDCEGFEEVLLSEASVPRLRRTTILLETHDYLAPGLTERLSGRFAPTHQLTRIDLRPRDPADYPSLLGLGEEARRRAVDEERRIEGCEVPQWWLLLEPSAA